LGGTVNRGDVYWYTFKKQDKRLPVLILTRNSAISFLESVTIAPITTTIRDIPSEVALSNADGMSTDCAVNLDSIQTVHKSRLGAFVTHLSPVLMRQVRKAAAFALGFDEI
jgi:mRNA interferase MazF